MLQLTIVPLLLILGLGIKNNYLLTCMENDINYLHSMKRKRYRK